MRRSLAPAVPAIPVVTVVGLLLLARPPLARAGVVEGEVVSTESRWTADGRKIVTVTTIRRADGGEVRVHQLGGTVDGIGMVMSHMPDVPAPGTVVRAVYTEGRTRAGAPAFALADIRPLSLTSAPERTGALPFVRTRTPLSQAPLYWQSGCIFVGYHQAGTTHIAGDTEFEVMDSVFDTWENAFGDCSYLQFQLDGLVDTDVGNDGQNIIRWREDEWCRPATDEDPDMCYNPQAAAITTLFFVNDPESDRDGEVVDADIEMNGVNFATSVNGQSLGNAGCEADLANTLTHEVGHVMGLDHTCWDGTGNRPIDENGDPIPSCIPLTSLPSDITEATMFNFQDCGETKKATPEEDDIDGVCGMFALANDPGECKRVALEEGGCCSVAGPTTGGRALGWLVLTGLVGLGLRGRGRGRERANARGRA